MFHENEGFSALFLAGIYGFFSFQPFIFGGFVCRPSTSKAGTATAPPNLRGPQFWGCQMWRETSSKHLCWEIPAPKCPKISLSLWIYGGILLGFKGGNPSEIFESLWGKRMVYVKQVPFTKTDPKDQRSAWQASLAFHVGTCLSYQKLLGKLAVLQLPSDSG